MQKLVLPEQRMTAIHYRRRLVEELEALLRRDMAVDAAARRSGVPLQARSRTGRIQQATAIQAEARRSVMRQEQIVQAIQRLDSSTYGFCGGCASLIEDERLSNDPCTTLCSLCSRLRA